MANDNGDIGSFSGRVSRACTPSRRLAHLFSLKKLGQAHEV